MIFEAISLIMGEGTAIIGKYTKIFGVQVNRKDYFKQFMHEKKKAKN